MSLCPCGSKLESEACCAPIVRGEKPAPTAEALMRARYAAHAMGEYDFLETSVHSSTRESVDRKQLKEWSSSVEWTGLDVVATEAGGTDDENGKVSFIARYAVNGVEQEMREDAEFIRENGQWTYLDGAVHGHTPYRRETPKLGRNEPCSCGSGKKYKKCCGK